MKTTEEILQAIAESGYEVYLSKSKSTLILENPIGAGTSKAWSEQGVRQLEDLMTEITGIKSFTTVPGYAEVEVSHLPADFVEVFTVWKEMSPEDRVGDVDSWLTTNARLLSANIYKRTLTSSSWSNLISKGKWPNNLSL